VSRNFTDFMKIDEKQSKWMNALNNSSKNKSIRKNYEKDLKK
jgi:hypothetical protein